MFIPQPTEGTFELAPAGAHLAVCYSFVDLGTQQETFAGQTRERRKIRIAWELSDEPMADGRPYTIGAYYTWSMHEMSKLRRDLESWRGAPFGEKDFGAFDTRNLLDKSCLLTIMHEEKGERSYANVTAVSKLVKGMQPRKAINPLVYFSLNPDRYDEQTYVGLPTWMREKIAKSPEYQEVVLPPVPKGNGPLQGRVRELPPDEPPPWEPD